MQALNDFCYERVSGDEDLSQASLAASFIATGLLLCLGLIIFYS